MILHHTIFIKLRFGFPKNLFANTPYKKTRMAFIAYIYFYITITTKGIYIRMYSLIYI